jgi:PII-like signaling protein
VSYFATGEVNKRIDDRAAGVATTSLVDAGGKLPLVIEFVDTTESVARAVSTLRKMVGDRPHELATGLAPKVFCWTN